MIDPEENFKKTGLSLPPAPNSIGVYKPVLIADNKWVYVSGHLPLQMDGTAITGKAGKDLDQEQAKLAAKQAALAILASLRSELGSLNKIGRLIKVLGMVNSTEDFVKQPYVINGCSELFAAIWGVEKGIGVRSAIGVAALPNNAAVEIEAIFELEPPH